MRRSRTRLLVSPLVVGLLALASPTRAQTALPDSTVGNPPRLPVGPGGGDEAQEEVRATTGFEHPRYWAAFQLVGAG